MPRTLTSTDSIPKQELLNALISYFSNERDKLGFDIGEHQISTACKTLLGGNEDTSDNFLLLQINEKSVFDEYRKEDFEIMDYLHLVSTEIRKQFGQYSTPSNIVNYILKSVQYSSSKNILNKKLIDPSCGSGAFLVEATRVYLNALKKANVPMSSWYQMFISATTGIDIDPKACFFARLNLSVLLAPAVLEFVAKNGDERLKPLPVYCTDTLELLASEVNNERFLYNRFQIPLKSEYDFVVGNPPYFKIKGLSKNLKRTFSDSIYGHPNAYGLFIHAGIEMLKDKGKLGFIVPRSMLSGLYFKNLRRLIERKTSLKEIVYISERKKVFDNVLHGTMILSLNRNKNYENKVDVSCAQSLQDPNNHHNKITIQENNLIQHLNGTSVWFVADSKEIYDIIDRIIKKYPLLSGNEINCCAKTGQIVWNRVKPLLSDTAKPNTLPLVWARDIGKFSFTLNRMGSSRPCFLRVNSKTKNLFVKGLSILVQRVTADEQHSRIVACIPAEFCNRESNGYFVENHLNVIQPEMQTEIDLYFILGILNSDIVDFFFRAMNGNTQVSATELNLLPIPTGKFNQDIAKIAKMIQKTTDDKTKRKLINELNLVVAKAYGLRNNELVFLKKYITYNDHKKLNGEMLDDKKDQGIHKKKTIEQF